MSGRFTWRDRLGWVGLAGIAATLVWVWLLAGAGWSSGSEGSVSSSVVVEDAGWAMEEV